MPSNDTMIESGVLPTGHPYARIGMGSRVVLSIPGLSFTHEPAKPASVRRAWKRWLEPIERHGLTFVEIGRRADLPPGSSSVDIADDYAAVIREQWGSAVGVMGVSTGGGYAQWLASRHPELVDRLVLGFTGHRIPADVAALQRRSVDHFLAGRWRSGYALFGGWFMPKHARLAGAAFWLLGPYVAGRPSDLRVLRIDADSDDGFDATEALGGIRCPTLVVSGALDLAYPPDLTRELVAGLPDVRHVEYPDVGHGFGAGPRFAEDACAFLAAPDARNVTALLDGTPGAFERAERGRAEAEAGLGTPLEELYDPGRPIQSSRYCNPMSLDLGAMGLEGVQARFRPS